MFSTPVSVHAWSRVLLSLPWGVGIPIRGILAEYGVLVDVYVSVFFQHCNAVCSRGALLW